MTDFVTDAAWGTILPTEEKETLLAAFVSGKDFRIVLVDGDYEVSAEHANLEDIPAGTRVAVSPVLTGITTTDGVFISDPVTFAAVTGADIVRAVLFVDGADEETSMLVAHVTTATGLPLEPNGADVDLTPNASGWFSV